MYSAHPYSISGEQLSEILETEQEQSQASGYLHCMSKAAQQKLHYALYCQVSNVFYEMVFTKTGVQQSEMVKLHLGLKDLVPERGLMDMWVTLNLNPLLVMMHFKAFIAQMERKIWSFCSSPFCLLRNNKKDQACWPQGVVRGTVPQVVPSWPRERCRPARCHCSLANSGW